MGDNEINSFSKNVPVENGGNTNPDNETTQNYQNQSYPISKSTILPRNREQNYTHMPYKSWCEHCVRVKAKADHQNAGDGPGSSETTIVLTMLL